MRCSMLFGSLILLLLATKAHGRLDMQLQAALHSKEEEVPADLKWQWRPPSSSGRPVDTRGASEDGRHDSGGAASEHHLTSMAPRAASAEEDGEVKKMLRVHHEVAPRLIHEDYSGPSGHSPNHHRTIPCGPC